MTYLTTLEFDEKVIPELILAKLCMKRSLYLDLRGICIFSLFFFFVILVEGDDNGRFSCVLPFFLRVLPFSVKTEPGSNDT